MENNSNRPSASYLSADTIVKGNIISTDSIVLEGIVEGMVSSQGNVELKQGSVGGIHASNIKISDSAVNGDLQALGSAFIDTNTVINGDIEAEQIQIKGKVNGTINVQDKVELFSSAVVKGDISSSNIGIEEGAFIQGKLNIVRK